ncbi:MAG: hypothetical protein LBG96_07685 [Tannerella sp.]|jgi:hypothetical protein|nr:hypothetical protein [Tannerella sp.]
MGKKISLFLTVPDWGRLRCAIAGLTGKIMRSGINLSDFMLRTYIINSNQIDGLSVFL